MHPDLLELVDTVQVLVMAFGVFEFYGQGPYFDEMSHPVEEYIDCTYFHLPKKVVASLAIFAARIAFSNFAIL